MINVEASANTEVRFIFVHFALQTSAARGKDPRGDSIRSTYYEMRMGNNGRGSAHCYFTIQSMQFPCFN
jgi:hypothetical protein